MEFTEYVIELSNYLKDRGLGLHFSGVVPGTCRSWYDERRDFESIYQAILDHTEEEVEEETEPLEEPPNDTTEEWIDMAINHEGSYNLCMEEAETYNADFKGLDFEFGFSEQWGIKDTYNIDWDYVKRYFEQDE